MNTHAYTHTQVSIIISHASHPSSSLLSPSMAAWQGPAIYLHNNAVFSPHDFRNLCRIGQGSKLDCLGKTGKFGLGFNAVYHFTDVPSFVSGEYLVWFDPHAAYLPGASVQHPGLRVKFTRSNILQQFPDQFKPYLLLGCDLQSEYKGTLFRFPLRTSAAASQSEIKKEAYPVEEVLQLVDKFRQMGPDALLFLKHIRDINIYEVGADGGDVRLQYRMSARASPPEDMARFLTLPTFVEGTAQAPVSKEAFFQTLRASKPHQLPLTDMTVDILRTEGDVVQTERWAILSALGGGEARLMAIDPANWKRGLRLVPWAGVAALLSREGQPSPAVKGRAFCFLPLPAETGLPVHVNGYFELSSNRRDIWRGDDMAGEGRTRAEWNRALLEDVVAPTYARLLQRIAGTDGLGPAQLEWYYSIWARCASSGGLQEPWSSLARQVYACLHHLPCLYVPPPLSAGEPSSGRQGTWVAPKEAMYVGMAGDAGATVRQALLEDGKPIVCVPDSVRESFAAAGLALEEASPAWMRQHMAQSKVAAVWRTKGQVRADTRLTLLEYCLADLDADADPRSPSGSKYAELCGLALVPAADGSSQTVARKGQGPAAALEGSLLVGDAAECGILYSLASTIVEPTLPDTVMLHMRSRAIAAYTNIHTLTAADVAACLSRVLPREWRGAAEVQWQPGKGGHPDADWLRRVWAYLEKDEARPGGPGRSGAALASFRDWPLLPTLEGTLCALGDIGPAAGQGTKV